jgi:hypothetical protein
MTRSTNSLYNFCICHSMIFPAVIILRQITSSHTATPLNYRMAVPADPIFAYYKFPEVYHGQGISKAPFSGGERPVTGQGRDTTYSVMSAENTATSCVSGPLRAGGRKQIRN